MSKSIIIGNRCEEFYMCLILKFLQNDHHIILKVMDVEEETQMLDGTKVKQNRLEKVERMIRLLKRSTEGTIKEYGERELKSSPCLKGGIIKNVLHINIHNKIF